MSLDSWPPRHLEFVEQAAERRDVSLVEVDHACVEEEPGVKALAGHVPLQDPKVAAERAGGPQTE